MPGAALRLLLIGNSLTAANDLPATLEAMARASGVEMRCAVVAKPNFSLEDHWNDGAARQAIARGGWTFVVLQQGPSALPESRVLLDDYTRRFDGEIRARGARTALFMVWPSASRRGDFDGVAASYAGAATRVGGLLLPAGDAWRAAWRRDPDLPLYGPDGFHPSRLGSYLAALVLFHTITGRMPPPDPVPAISALQLEIVRAAAMEVSGHSRGRDDPEAQAFVGYVRSRDAVSHQRPAAGGPHRAPARPERDSRGSREVRIVPALCARSGRCRHSSRTRSTPPGPSPGLPGSRRLSS
jgi:hypothetical protein